MRKKVKRIKTTESDSLKKIEKKCSRVSFIKIQTNSHASQVGRLFFTQKFSNRKIFFAAFVFNQIRNNFYFEELSS